MERPWEHFDTCRDNLDRHIYFFCEVGYEENYTPIFEIETDKGRTGYSRIWIEDHNGKRIPNTTAYDVYEEDMLLEQFNSLKEAKEYFYKYVCRKE